MATKLCYLLNAKGSEKANIIELKELLDKPYDGTLGFGFSDTTFPSATSISSVLIFSSVVKSKLYDQEVNSFVIVSRSVIQEVSFEIDFVKSVLIVQGGTEKIKRLLTILGVMTKNKMTFEAIRVDIPKVIHKLSLSLTYFKLTGVVVTNFQPRPDIIGRFAARISNSVEAERLLQEYQFDTTEFTADAELEDEELRLRMTNSGAVALGGADDAIQKGLSLLIDVVKEKDNA